MYSSGVFCNVTFVPCLVGVLRRTVFTAATMIYGQLILILWYVNKKHHGSFTGFYEDELKQDPMGAMMKAFIAPQDVSMLAWKFIFGFFAVSLALMRLVPGKIHEGPVTPTGHVPKYIVNGVSAFVRQERVWHMMPLT